MNNRQVIRINERQLKQIVTESVKRVLKESWYDKYKTTAEKKKDRNERNGTLRHFNHSTNRGVKNRERIENQRNFLKKQTDIGNHFSKRLKEPDKWTEKFLKSLNEQEEIDDDFTLGPSHMTDKSTHRQVISYKGKEIGYLLYTEHGGPMSWLCPVDEAWVLPDVEYGLEIPQDKSGLLDGKKGWIDFKVFKNDSDSAIAYAKANFDKIAYLFEYGDYD